MANETDRKNILVVEDNSDLNRIIRYQSDQNEYSKDYLIDLVETGEKALNYIDNNKNIDLIVLHLTEKEGYTMIKHLVDNTSTTPVIFIYDGHNPEKVYTTDKDCPMVVAVMSRLYLSNPKIFKNIFDNYFAFESEPTQLEEKLISLSNTLYPEIIFRPKK